MAAIDYHTVIQKLYVAYFGRPADPAGLAFAANLLNNANAPTTSEGFVASYDSNIAVQTLLNGFGASAESSNFYLSATIEARVNQIYRNVLGRDAEMGGITYWTNEITSGRLTLAKAAFVILQAAEKHTTGDGLVVAAKVAIATGYTLALDLPAEISAYSTATAASSARGLLSTVTATSTLAGFQATIDANIAALFGGGMPPPAPSPAPAPGPAPSPPAPSPAPSTALTTGVDALVGSSGAETYAGLVATAGTTFQATDSINGADGTDTLNLTIGAGVGASTQPAATISAVEIISVMNLSGNTQTVTATNFTGATQFNADRSTAAVVFNAMASDQAAGIIGDGLLVNGASTFNFATTAPNMTLNLAGGTRGAGAITVTGTGIASSTINSTAAANVVGTIALAATNTSLAINAASNLTTGNITGFATTAGSVTITGAAASVNIGTLNNNVATLNASGLSAGGVTATLGGAGSALVAAITGGGGNDVFTAGAALTTGTVNAADGTGDTLIVTTTAHLNSAALGAKYTNFEALQANNGVTLNLDHIAGITAVRVNAAATATGFTNLTATQAGAVQVLGGGAGVVTLGLKDALGLADTVKISVNDGLITTTTVTLTAPVLTNIERVEFTATDNLTVTTLASAAELTAVQLQGAGAVSLTTGAVTKLATLDGSLATGNLTLNASGILTGATTGLALSGGAGFDTLTGTQKADVYTGGGGQNRFTFAASATSNITTAGLNFDTIADFRAGIANIIDYTPANITVVTGGTGAAGQAFIGATGIASFNAADTTLTQQLAAVTSAMAVTGGVVVGEATIWQSGADAWLYIAGDTTAAIASTDLLIKLTGVTVGAAGLTITGGDITAIA